MRRERARRWIQNGMAVMALVAGGALTAACHLAVGVDGLTASGPCDELGRVRCKGNKLEECIENGSWQPTQLCDNQACSCKDESCENFVCVGECIPERKRCNDLTPEIWAVGQI
jgi:hypothetical protein